MTTFSKADAEAIATIADLNASPTAIAAAINNAVEESNLASTIGMLSVLETFASTIKIGDTRSFLTDFQF